MIQCWRDGGNFQKLHVEIKAKVACHWSSSSCATLDTWATEVTLGAIVDLSSFLNTIGGTCLTNWQSKKQPTVALSNCEAETKAGTVLAQDDYCHSL